MHPISPDDILDAALRCAADRHWEAVRLADVAAALGVTLADIHPLVADKEALVDVLWDRADRALLLRARDDALALQPVPERLESLVFSWLQPLAPHRRCLREMLLVRLEPGHLHIQVPTLIRISRTVQWLREAAGLRAAFAWRALEESVLTALFVTAVVTWLRDNGDDAARGVLRAGLHAAHTLRKHIGPRDGADKGHG
ncbi:MAG TPA: TetR/AcrR family transcriptional regulator [Gammaproteobacteria bacterium]